MKSNVDPPGPASEKIRKLFELVADLDAVRRQVLLAESGATREEIAAVTGLLLADRTEASVFDVAPADWAIHLRIDDRAVESMTGASFGPYRILDMIGKGGSSVVFRAVRHVGDAEQTVALKILDRGLFSDESRRRFRREQQILAQFSHANVARLIDGGVSEAGIPYIAMEFVDGMRLTDFASVRGLDREARLHLIRDLCRVVEAAHRALIVHRDLKPSNVLVAHGGEIKVLDFGTAKLLDGDESALTQTSAIELTPGYAAPEQYRPGLVTTAADVYALGVLASELLFGVRLGPDAMWPDDAPADRAARSGWRDLDPDLQRMLQAALSSDPTLRYRSAGYFADDIVRLLRGEPVSVHPPSSMYRMRKFVSRNRGGVSAAAVSVAALAFGLGLAAWQARMATMRAQQAAIELQRANAMRDFMFAAFGETEPTTPRARPATVLEAVERAIEEARSDRGLAPAVRIEMLTRLGTIVESQGKLDESAELLAWNAKEAARALGRDDPLTLDAERSVADNQLLRGNFTEARTLADALLARPFSEREDIRIRALSLSANLATKEHDLARARREGANALERSRRLGDSDVLRLVLEDYGNILLAIGDSKASLPVYQELLDVARARFGDEHATVASVQASLSRVYRRLGNLDAAERSARAALDIDRKVHRVDDWRTALHLNALMVVLKEHRDFRRALETELEGLRIDRVTLGDAHPDTLTGLNNIGVLYLLMEDYASAKAPLREALEGTKKHFGDAHWQTAFVRVNYGYALARTGSVEAGDAEMERACTTFMSLPEPDFDACATAREKQVRLFLDLGRYAKAMRLVDDLEEQVQRIPDPDSYWIGRAATLRGAVLLAADRSREALWNLEQASDALNKAVKPERALAVENVLLLALAERNAQAFDRARIDAERGQMLLRDLPFPPRSLLQASAALQRASSQKTGRRALPRLPQKSQRQQHI